MKSSDRVYPSLPDAAAGSPEALDAIARADALLGQEHYLPDGLLAGHAPEELVFSQTVIRAERKARTPLFYAPDDGDKEEM